GRDLAGVLAGLVKQLRGWDDVVDEAPALGGLRVDEIQQEPDLARPLLPDDAGQVGGTETGVERPDPGAGLPETGGLRGDRQIAEHMEHVTAADRYPVDRSDDRLGHVADHAVQAFDLEDAPLRLAIGAGLGPLLHVATGTEGAIPRTGRDDGRHTRVNPGVFEGGQQLIDGPATEGVHPVRPVDRDDREG